MFVTDNDSLSIGIWVGWGAVVLLLSLRHHRLNLARAAHRNSEAAHEETLETLRKTEAKFRSIFENAVEGIFQTTPDGKYLSANPSLARMYGFESPAELMTAIRDIKRSLYVDPTRRNDFVAEMQRSDVISRFESEIYRKDGSTIWISENARVVREANGEVAYYEGTVVDITEQKRSESLRREKETADAANRAKSLFLANMSHELRTPLNGALGMLDLMADTTLTAQQRRYVEIAKTSADQLLNVINQILDYSKIEAGMLELECIDFDLRSLMEDTLDMLSAKAVEKQIELALHMPPELPSGVRGDPHRLRQVVLNLLGNAIKFTSHGQVVVRVAQEKETADEIYLRVAVEDTGVGIPADRFDRLFQSFSQADSSATRRYGGTGLGLAISKQLVELMKGQIGVQSQLHDGSTFWFRLPLQKSHAIAQQPEALPAQLNGLRVLVVDDNATNRELLFRYLSNWHCRAQTAPNGQTALEMLRETAAANRPFDLAILDGHMPLMDGFELAKEIADDNSLAQTRLVMLTSLASALDGAELAALGIGAYLNKPVRQALLRDALARVAAKPRGSGEADETATPSAQAEPAATIATSARPQARLLLVEDNEINRLVALEILDQAGYRCDVAVDGQEGVERLLAFPYDAVLMDCQMPVMDGFTATAEIRRLEREGALAARGYRVPVVALTANAIDGDREACLSAGMDGYLTKPLDALKLIELLDILLENLDRRAGEVTPVAGVTAAEGAMADTRTDCYGTSCAFDWDSLHQRCRGNSAFIDKMLATLAARLPADAAAIHTALADGDFPAAARLVHTVKGAAANLSATRLLAVAGKLESACRSLDGTLTAALELEMHVEVDRCREAIAQRTAKQQSALSGN